VVQTMALYQVSERYFIGSICWINLCSLFRRFFHGDDKSGMARMDLIENAETDRIINGRFPGFIDNTIYRYKGINSINFHTYIHTQLKKCCVNEVLRNDKKKS